MVTRSSDILLILVAILFPPAAVAFTSGCSCDLLISVLLTVFGYLPGLVHSLWLLYKRFQAQERFGDDWQYEGSGHYEPMYKPVPSQPPAYGTV